MITHLLDSIGRQKKIKLISTQHEQAAAFAAEGSARITGVPGVAMATSGPGATNLLTGIGSCYFDSVPAVFITGQVNTSEQKGRRRVRQVGFQETDIVRMARPITKSAHMVRSAGELPGALADAFRIARSGRPGPVLVDLPMDIQRTEIKDLKLPIENPSPRKDPPHSESWEDLLSSALAKSHRPLLLVGGGVRAAGAAPAFRTFARRLNIPVVASLLGLDAMPHTDPLFVGMIGTYGNRYANMAVAAADFLLVIGSRLDVRQTGSNPATFRKGKTVIHLDVDPAEINHRVKGCTAIHASMDTFFDRFSIKRRGSLPEATAWKTTLAKWKQAYPGRAELRGIPGINPNGFLEDLSRLTPSKTNYITDVGQHQMWAAQSLVLSSQQRFLTSGGMGAMGFGLPCAIGASFAAPHHATILIAGDGGFQTNIHELQTIRKHNLPIKIIILNNHSHGMVRQFQQSYFKSRYYSTLIGYSCPDFAKVAQAYGIPARRVRTPREASRALNKFLSDAGPALLDLDISIEANASHKVTFGRPLGDMEPRTTPPPL